MDIPALIKMRARRFAQVRAFFETRGFLETDTPLLVRCNAVETHIDPIFCEAQVTFEGAPQTHQLITSPELSMKRLLAAGCDRIFQLGSVFRDAEITSHHRVEFTLLEWYRTHASLDDLIKDVIDLFGVFELPQRFEIQSVAKAFEQHLALDLDALLDEQKQNPLALVNAMRAKQIALRENADFEDAFFAGMQIIEDSLDKNLPHVLTRWPAHFAALAKKCDDDARYAQRFEIYYRGLELANAFEELTDADEQRKRFEEDNRARQRLGKNTLPIDEHFLNALENMPSSCGIALGVDRLLMVLENASSIDEVRLSF